MVVSLLGILCAGGLAAEQSRESSRERPTQPSMGPSQRQTDTQQMRGMSQQADMLQRAGKLIGKQVKNTSGEDMGNIHDLVLTSDYQQVSYLALSRGGTWGIGDKLFAIPWTAIQVGPQGDIILPISKDQLQDAAGFNQDNWPAQPGARWMSTGMTRGASEQQMPTTGQRGTTPQGSTRDTTPGMTGTSRGGTADASRSRDQEGTTGQMWSGERGMAGQSATRSQDVRYRRVSHLTGMSVKNTQGEDIGNLEDFVIDTREGRLAYTIVSFGGFWGIGESFAAVPFSAVQLQPRRNLARLDASRETLEAIAFKPSEFPDLANREYAQRIHETFNAEPYWIIYGYVPGEGQQATSEKVWGPESTYLKSFDASKIKTIKGTVQNVGTFQPDEAVSGAPDGLRLRVLTDEGNLVTVYAGPRWFAEQQNFMFKPGDKITITGSDTKIGWRPVLMATEIDKDGQVLHLGDKGDTPNWRWLQPGQQRPRPGAGQQPGATQPGGMQPGGTRPGGTQPGTTQPGGTQSGTTQPGGTQSGGATQPQPGQ